jgi:protein-S-isoprenylcysteine O-methyltransferase Ste14
MKTFFISASGLDARGVGPRIILRTIPLVLVAVALGIFAPQLVNIGVFDNTPVKTFGWIWLAFGIAAFAASLAQFIANFPKGKLISTGMYACSRNPIYSCWIVFILPALAFVLNNWFFFAAAYVMCRSTLVLVREEEKDLLHVFGKEYEEYKGRVGSIVRFAR